MHQKIKYSKIYPKDGFLVFEVFGCNFRCSGMGMPAGEQSIEFTKINPDNYKSVYDLPNVNSGCTTYYSWDTRFKHLDRNENITKVAEDINSFGINSIKIGGGEPMLIQNKLVSLFECMDRLKPNVDRLFTIETNTTQIMTEKFTYYVSSSGHEFKFICSPKLPSSGVSVTNSLNSEAYNSYFLPTLKSSTEISLVFTVTDPDRDEYDINRFIREYAGYGSYDIVRYWNKSPVYTDPLCDINISPHVGASELDRRKIQLMCENHNLWNYSG